MYLWVRLGDNGDYQDYGDDFDALAGYFVEMGVPNKLQKKDEYSYITNGYEGHNYISLYWGDKVASPIRGLTNGELSQLRTAVRLVDFVHWWNERQIA